MPYGSTNAYRDSKNSPKPPFAYKNLLLTHSKNVFCIIVSQVGDDLSIVLLLDIIGHFLQTIR